MEVLLAGLDESEVEALSTGPLRNLSISHGSFSQAHQHALEQQQQQHDAQQQQQQQHMAPVAEGPAEPFTSLREAPLQEAQLHEIQQQQQVAATDLAQVRPELPNIFTSSSSKPPSAATAVDAAVDNAEDLVIEELVEEMLLHVCCNNMPSKIELGDSPTRSTSLTRKLAFEGAGPSRLVSTSKPAETAAACSAVVSPQAVQPAAAAERQQEQAGKQQQQQQERGASVADSHVVRSFMEGHCSQLTPYGLASLAESLKEHQLAVFFR
jgi:asparagine synthetase B (glutamine-hydrolysing)